MSPKETDLYPPLKTFLEGQGYEVKSEITGCDIVAQRADTPPVVVEMKLGFSLALFHQGIARQALTDAVYLAVPLSRSKAFRNNIGLARRLGLGVLAVRLKDGHVDPVCDPGPFQPRKSKTRQTRLLREFARRQGDPNSGGSRGKVITAYRQDAEKIAAFLRENGPAKGALVARETGVARATDIMAKDHYGWFERVERGIYRLAAKNEEG